MHIYICINMCIYILLPEYHQLCRPSRCHPSDPFQLLNVFPRAILSDAMYSSIGFETSTVPQNCQLNILIGNDKQ